MSYNPEWFKANRSYINDCARARRAKDPEKVRAQQRAVRKRMREREKVAHLIWASREGTCVFKKPWANQHGRGLTYL